ncbi:MAG: metallophosphoesterase [Verrucomicrobiota bacterium]|nr:metallophosphoesterase [Verrucomicrobiota bacterium]
MERIIIIPDIHYRLTVVNTILEREYAKADKIIFLGDYFDTQDHSHESAAVTSLWIKGLLNDKKCVCLLGNHDMQYLFPKNNHFRVKGFNAKAARIISEIFKPTDLNKFSLYWIYKKWVMSHAGIHPGFIPGGNIPLRTQLGLLSRNAFRAAHEGHSHSFLEAGYARHGRAAFGGVTWLDFEEEFMPIRGLNQIVGHTRGLKVRFIEEKDSRNYCLDAQGRYYAVLNENRLQVKKFDSDKIIRNSDIKKLVSKKRL